MQHAQFSQMMDVGDAGTAIEALVASDGSAAHPHVQMLSAAANSHGARPLAALADAAHYLCLLHGRSPGVVDYAATRCADNAARRWLMQAIEAFPDERAYLTRLTVALGPVPSTPGQQSCDSVVLQQRHALEMLSQSDRRGCAMGAAIALVLDWAGIRRLLDQAALRTGLEPKKCSLPTPSETLAVARAVAAEDTVARAILFGGRQLLGQHHSLWDVMETRARARAAE